MCIGLVFFFFFFLFFLINKTSDTNFPSDRRHFWEVCSFPSGLWPQMRYRGNKLKSPNPSMSQFLIFPGTHVIFVNIALILCTHLVMYMGWAVLWKFPRLWLLGEVFTWCVLVGWVMPSAGKGCLWTLLLNDSFYLQLSSFSFALYPELLLLLKAFLITNTWQLWLLLINNLGSVEGREDVYGNCKSILWFGWYVSRMKRLQTKTLLVPWV